MRNMSFSLTTEQIRNKTKFVTRRLGWRFLKVGEYVQVVEKCQGLKKGEKIKKITVIKVVSTARQMLNEITQRDCFLEGFPKMTPKQFIKMFCNANKCPDDIEITRIKFEYVIKKNETSDLTFGYQ
jgi:hypothetical protein